MVMTHQIITQSGKVFEIRREMMDASSLCRPDMSWAYTDKAGHAHRWFAKLDDGMVIPATSYRPELSYLTPTLRSVHDGWGYYEDGEEYEMGHLECLDC